MAQIFLPKVMEDISNSKEAVKEIQRQAQNLIEEEAGKIAMQMQDDFEKHKVTQEIDGGESTENISHTMSGDKIDNLFSFIGFDQGSNPLQEIRKIIYDSVKNGAKSVISTGKDYRRGQTVLRMQFKIITFTLQDIYNAGPMPWAKGISWVERIENEIPGIARFLPKWKKDGTVRSGWNDDKSHSKGGIQIKRDMRSTKFRAPAGGYFTKIMQDFTNRLKNIRVR